MRFSYYENVAQLHDAPTRERPRNVVSRWNSTREKLSDSDNRNETFGRLVLERRPGAVVVRLGRVQVARGHDARRGRQHVVAPRRVDADRAGEAREAVAEAGLRRPREEVRVRRGARVRVFCSNPREGSQHAREVLSLAAAVECEAVRVTACVEIKILRRVRAE